MSFQRAKLENSISDLGDIYVVEGKPILQAIRLLRKKGVESLISFRDSAARRIALSSERSGREATLDLISDAIIYIPNQPFDLCIRDSPIIATPEITEGKYSDRGESRGIGSSEDILLSSKEVSGYLQQAEENKNKDPIERRVFMLYEGEKNYCGALKSFSVPTSKLKEDEFTAWAFRDMAEDYGRILKEESIDYLRIGIFNKPFINNSAWSKDGHGKAFLRQFDMAPIPMYGSKIWGYYGTGAAKLRGVLKSSQ